MAQGLLKIATHIECELLPHATNLLFIIVSLLYNEALSSSRALECGVPQGSVSSSMALTITATLTTFKYICNVETKDNDIDIHEYISRLQNCILEISNWMMMNSLKINGDKTEFIIFGSKHATYKVILLKLTLVLYQLQIASRFLGCLWIAR